MKTSHKAALMAADLLTDYCMEHWDHQTAECYDCIFQKGKRNCRLHIFLGFNGKEMKAEIDAEIRQRCKELTE